MVQNCAWLLVLMGLSLDPYFLLREQYRLFSSACSKFAIKILIYRVFLNSV